MADAETPNAKPATPNAGASAPAASKPKDVDVAALVERLNALEAKQAAQEEAVEEANPTYAQTKDSADKSRYFEATEDVYAEVGLAGPEGNYADLAKVDEMYHAEKGSDEDKHVIAYRVRTLGDEVVISYIVDPGAEKGILYPNK